MPESIPNHTPSIPALSNEKVVFALRKIARSFALYSKQLEKHTGLSASQLLLLKIIGNSRKKSIGDIARMLSLSQATATGIVKRLERRGLINKTRDESDRRRMMIEITAAGNHLIKSAPPLLHQAFVNRFTELASWEQAMLLSSLERLAILMESGSRQTPAAA